MLARILLFPLALIIVLSASYEVWQRLGVPTLTAEASEALPAPAVVITSGGSSAYSFTYTNHPFNFSITYPRGFLRNSTAQLGWSYGAENALGITVLTLTLPPQSLYVQNGGQAELRIGTASDTQSVKTCLAPSRRGISQGIADIQGVAFSEFSYPAAGIESYRIMHGGICYALEIQVTDAAGAASSDAQSAKALLENALSTFIFS
jgi:hypothetical protein